MMYQVANWFPCSSHKWTEDHQCAITGQNPRLLPQCSGSPVTGRGSDCYNPKRLIYIKHSGHEDRTIFGPLWTQVKSRRATAWADMTVVTLAPVSPPLVLTTDTMLLIECRLLATHHSTMVPTAETAPLNVANFHPSRRQLGGWSGWCSPIWVQHDILTAGGGEESSREEPVPGIILQRWPGRRHCPMPGWFSHRTSFKHSSVCICSVWAI